MKRNVSIVLALIGVALLLLRSLAWVAVTAAATASLPQRETVRDGAWIWTRADAEIFAQRGELARHAVPGVLVLTIDEDTKGALRGRRGLSPSSVSAAEVAAVVRIEDSVAPRLADPTQLARDLDERLAVLRRELESTSTSLAEVQLDFDVPVRRLDGWAEVAGHVAHGSLDGIPVWVTSIPAHLADPRYGTLFQPVVAGHVYQVFDTGLPCNAGEIAKVRGDLERAAMPYRIGIATFEREREGRPTTQHACWANATRKLWQSPRYAGAWVFPASRSIDDAFSLLQVD